MQGVTGREGEREVSGKGITMKCFRNTLKSSIAGSLDWEYKTSSYEDTCRGLSTHEGESPLGRS